MEVQDLYISWQAPEMTDLTFDVSRSLIPRPMWLVPRFHVHHGMTRPHCGHPQVQVWPLIFNLHSILWVYLEPLKIKFLMRIIENPI